MHFQFGGNPVSCAIGIAVFDVMQNEQLMSSAKFVGRTLLEGFRNILDRHPMMGDVRFETCCSRMFGELLSHRHAYIKYVCGASGRLL